MTNLLTETQQMLSSIPQCAKQLVFQAVTDSGCGYDINCLCTNKTFFAQLQAQLPHLCSLIEVGGSFSGVSKLCVEAVPSLSESRESTILGTTIAFLTLATLAVILRLWARKVSAAKFGVDDVLIMLALICAYGNDIILFLAVRSGYGKHAIVLSAKNLLDFAKDTWVDQIFFACSVTFTKLSILFFYHRIFPSTTFNKISIITGVFMVLWLVAAIFGVVFSCVPVSYFWDKSNKTGGRCINQYTFTHSLTALNIFTDVVVLVLPIPWLLKLQMKPARKLAILGTSLFGGFICIAAIVRIFFINMIHWSDASYSFVDLGIWLNVECNMGIVSACLPILPPLLNCVAPLFKRLRHSVVSSKGGSSSARGSVLTAESNPANAESERGSPLERRDDRVKRSDEGSEMSSLEQRTPKAGSFAEMGLDHEAQNVHLRD